MEASQQIAAAVRPVNRSEDKSTFVLNSYKVISELVSLQ